jgi:hypothetical protein
VAAERPRLNVRPQHCTQSMQGDVLKNVMALVIDVILSCSVATTARQWPLSAFFWHHCILLWCANALVRAFLR